MCAVEVSSVVHRRSSCQPPPPPTTPSHSQSKSAPLPSRRRGASKKQKPSPPSPSRRFTGRAPCFVSRIRRPSSSSPSPPPPTFSPPWLQRFQVCSLDLRVPSCPFTLPAGGTRSRDEGAIPRWCVSAGAFRQARTETVDCTCALVVMMGSELDTQFYLQWCVCKRHGQCVRSTSRGWESMILTVRMCVCSFAIACHFILPFPLCRARW